MDPLVTIIIPVYNVEEYLPKCVRSACRQTYPNLEIILVDDGSTDGGGQLCDRFAGEDARIRVIHQENGGVSAARNAGLDAARGRYVYFADGDDWMPETMVEETLPVIEAGGYDLCVWGMNLVQEGKEDVYFGRWRTELFSFPTEEERRRFLCRWVLPCRIGWSVYCRAFRREIIQRFGLRFHPECRLFEDLDFFFRYAACCRNLYYIPKPLYAYRQHGASAMHTHTLQKKVRALLKIIRQQGRELAGQPLFDPLYIYAGTLLVVFLWNFTERGAVERGLVQAVEGLKDSEDWAYLLEQARRAEKDPEGIRRVCGWRLGGQVNGFYRYLLTGDAAAYCRAAWAQRCFTALRTKKNAVLHGLGGTR